MKSIPSSEQSQAYSDKISLKGATKALSRQYSDQGLEVGMARCAVRSGNDWATGYIFSGEETPRMDNPLAITRRRQSMIINRARLRSRFSVTMRCFL